MEAFGATGNDPLVGRRLGAPAHPTQPLARRGVLEERQAHGPARGVELGRQAPNLAARADPPHHRRAQRHAQDQGRQRPDGLEAGCGCRAQASEPPPPERRPGRPALVLLQGRVEAGAEGGAGHRRHVGRGKPLETAPDGHELLPLALAARAAGQMLLDRGALPGFERILHEIHEPFPYRFTLHDAASLESWK